MDKTASYRLAIDQQMGRYTEDFIEKLFHQWHINEVYLGNVVTSFSNLIHLLSKYPGEGAVDFTASLKDEILSFALRGMDTQISTFFLKDYLLQDISDHLTQSVFIIQQMADMVSVEGEDLILQFNTGALPATYLNHRKQTFENAREETREKVLND